MTREHVQNAELAQASSKEWMVPFFTIWVGQALSLLGSQVAGFAVIWWMTTATGSAAVLTTGALLDSLPRILVGPLAGTLIDRWNRRRVMIVADAVTALAAGILVYPSWVDVLQIWHLYVLGLVRATGGTFHWLAMQTSTALMVPPDQLTRVQGLNQTLNGAMNIIAPALGALVISILPLHGALSIDLGTAVLAIVPLLFIVIPQPSAAAVSASSGARSVGRELREGLRYIWDWAGLRTVILVAVACNLVSVPPMVLMPILVTRHFGGGAAELASVQAAWPLGLVLGGLLLSVWGGFRRKTTSLTVGLLCSCASLMLVGLAPKSAIWLAWIGLLTAGIVNTFINGPLFALVQTVVKPDMQGRVMATMISLANAMTPLGLVFAGPLADRTGVRPWFVVGASVLLLSGVITLVNPAVRRMEDGRGDGLAYVAPHP